MKFVLIGTHSPLWVGRHEERSPRAFAKCNELGITVIANYFTQGQYDYVTIVEAADPESVSAFSVWYMQEEFGRVQTMLAYDAEGFNRVVGKSQGNGN